MSDLEQEIREQLLIAYNTKSLPGEIAKNSAEKATTQILKAVERWGENSKVNLVLHDDYPHKNNLHLAAIPLSAFKQLSEEK